MQAQPHQTHEIHSIVPGVGQFVAEGGRRRTEVYSVAAVRISALIGIRLSRHGKVVQAHLLPAAVHHQVECASLIQAKQQVHALPIDGHQPVPGLQAVGALQRTTLGKAGDHRLIEPLRRRIQAEDDNKPRQKIHGRAGGKNDQLFPKALAVQRRRIVRVLLFPLHGTETAHRKSPQRILGIPPLLFP